MVNILFWVSLYFLAVTIVLLFFGCAKYNESPYIANYKNEIGNFYNELTDKLINRGEKISGVFFADTIIGSCYRHSLSKLYLRNQCKLRELEFTEKQIEDINELIVPGFEERNTLFNMLKVINVFFAIIAGVLVGLLIKNF